VLSPRGFPITTMRETRKIDRTKNKKSRHMERRNNGTGRIQQPNPKECWRLEEIRIWKTDYRKKTTRPNISQGHHTALKTHKERGCKTTWGKRLKLLETYIPWREIGRNIANGIGTKNDTSSRSQGSKTYYTFKAMYLKGITTTTRTIRCTSYGRSHED